MALFQGEGVPVLLDFHSYGEDFKKLINSNNNKSKEADKIMSSCDKYCEENQPASSYQINVGPIKIG